MSDTPEPRRWTLETDRYAPDHWDWMVVEPKSEPTAPEKVEVVEAAAYDELQRERNIAIERAETSERIEAEGQLLRNQKLDEAVKLLRDYAEGYARCRRGPDFEAKQLLARSSPEDQG